MAYRPSAGRNQRRGRGPKDPDLIPIMNLFLALIPMLLFMLVIAEISLVALNFTSSGGGGGGGGQGAGGGKTEEKKISVFIMNQDPPAPERGLYRGFEIREPGKDNIHIRLDDNSDYDFVTLDQVLKQIRGNNPEQTEISVSPYPDVLYGPLIKTIDLCKENNFINVMYKPTGVAIF